MASEPIPEPLTNQDLEEKREPDFSASRPNIADNGEAINAVTSGINPARELSAPRVNPELNKAAEAVGSAIGRFVNRARQTAQGGENAGPSLVETVQVKAGEARQKLSDNLRVKTEETKEKVSQTITSVRESAAEGFQQTKERVSETIVDVQQKTADALRQTRVRANDIAYNYPLQVIAGSVAAGFVAGVLLRLWRSSRYE